MSFFTIILLILAIIAVLVVALYNSLVKLRNKINEAWSDIDTQLKRRYDLIPNIVETVKGYAAHESGTLEKVTQARNMAMSATGLQDKEKAENMLSDTLKSLFALAENYPDLKANQNFLQLQTTLKEIEEHIQMSRRYYNGTVRDFNTKLQVFPNNFIAGPLGFTAKEFFQATDEEKQNVKVSFVDQVTATAKDIVNTAVDAKNVVMPATPASPTQPAQPPKPEPPKPQPPKPEPPKPEPPKPEPPSPVPTPVPTPQAPAEPPKSEPPKPEEPKQ